MAGLEPFLTSLTTESVRSLFILLNPTTRLRDTAGSSAALCPHTAFTEEDLNLETFAPHGPVNHTKNLTVPRDVQPLLLLIFHLVAVFKLSVA